MKNVLVITIVVLLISSSFRGLAVKQPYIIQKGNVTYDFTFAELAIKFIETNDTNYLKKIAESAAAQHIYNHANHFNYDVPKSTTLELVKYLLTNTVHNRTILHDFTLNLQYAKDSIAKCNLAQTECLKYLPNGFEYARSTHLFFTFGYDLGVVFAGNASVNLAHPYYLKNRREIKYYAIHELHHAGFVQLKNNKMVDMNIQTYSEMAEFIEYLTHLEGMGTFAPWSIRKHEGAMGIDKDYIALQDSVLMKDDENEYFTIYNHFKNSPKELITDEDWNKVNILSDKKRLWYRVGALMANKIDNKLGRIQLTNLITKSPDNFIKIYLSIKNE